MEARSAARRRSAPIRSSTLWFALALVALEAGCRLDSLYVIAFATQKGADNGQPTSVLSSLDQSGVDNDRSRYVAFYPSASGYTGVFGFRIPADVSRGSITNLYVGTNFKGRPKSQQTWTFELWDVNAGQWVVVGDNATAQAGLWTTMQLEVSDPTRFVASGGDIQLRYATTTAIDSSKLDFLALALGSDTSPAPGPTGGLHNVFKGSYDRDDPDEVSFVAHHDLQVMGIGPTKLDELRAQNASLTALYYLKIAGVHGPETRPPSGDPQWSAAVANNLLWKGASGQYVRNTTNGWYYINVQDPTKRAKWWNLQKTTLDPQMAYYDGIFYDNATTITSDFEDLVTEPPVGYDEQQYYDGLYSLLTSTRSAYPGKKVFLNTYAGWETPGFRGLELMGAADGLVFEGFSFKVRAGFFDKARLLQQLTDFASVVRGGKSAVALDYADAPEVQERTLSLACYMLVVNDHALHFLSSPEVDSDVQQWPEDDLDLGSPLGDYVQTATGLLTRDFTGGRIVVNPEDTRTLSYSVGSAAMQKVVLSGGGAWPSSATLAWQSVSGNLSMAPMSGLVLRNAPN